MAHKVIMGEWVEFPEICGECLKYSNEVTIIVRPHFTREMCKECFESFMLCEKIIKETDLDLDEWYQIQSVV